MEPGTGWVKSTSLLSRRVLAEVESVLPNQLFILKLCYVAISGIIVIILISNLKIEPAMFFSSN